MPTDPEIRDKYLRFLREEAEVRHATAVQLRELAALAKLEDDAQGMLTTPDFTLLNEIGITDRTDHATLIQQMQAAIAERDVIRRLAQKVEVVP